MPKRRGKAGGSGGSSGSRPQPTKSSAYRAARSWLPSRSSFAAAEAITLGALVTYDVMQTQGKQAKMPRPAPIVATCVVYAMLAAAASISRTWEPLATAVAWVITLAVLVTGRRGQGLVGLLSKMAGYVSTLGGDTASAPAASPAH